MFEQILFVGDERAGHFVPEVTPKSVKYTGSYINFADVKPQIIKENYSTVIIELRQFVDHYELLAEEIESVSRVSNALFIFFFLGGGENSAIIQELLKRGFTHFVINPLPGKAREEFQNCLLGVATLNLKEAPEELFPVEEKENKPGQTIISVAGCCSRIGTTTQALQIVKYLQYVGHRACYIQMNGGHMVEGIRNLYDVQDVDKELGRVTYNGIDMYALAHKIVEIKEGGYDYLVYDFGSMKESTFHLIQFLEKDIKVVVGGISPDEMQAMQLVYRNTIVQNVNYIFSFVHPNDFADIRAMQEDKAERTFFAHYTPDAFIFTADSVNLYEPIIKAPRIAGKKQRRGLFKKGHRP